MAEEMTNGTDPTRMYPDASAAVAALSERITNLNRRQTDNEAENRAAFRSMESTIDKLGTEMRSGLANLATNLADRNKPQWQALGVALTFAAMLGGLAYLPIREATTDLKNSVVETNRAIQVLAANTVSRQEMDWRAARGTEDRKRTDESVASLRDTMVYRNEWQERNLSRDHDIENIRSDAERDTANLQRQLDQIRADLQLFANSMGNGRGFITDLKAEQSRLRDQISALTAKVAAEQAAAR